MSNVISTAKINRAIEMAQKYLWSTDLEDGTNATTLYDKEKRIEVDIEVYCEKDLSYNSGTYLIPPSYSGSVTNEPVSIVAWFFDKDYDNPTDKDITNMLSTYKYAV